MRVLLDECIDRRLARDLPGHEVRHVRAIGWASLDDRELLRRADGIFDIFVTVDRGIALQQNLSGLAIAVVILRVKRNTRTALAALLPALLEAMPSAARGSVTWLGDR